MSVPRPAIPTPPRSDWLRGLAAITLIAVTFAALAVGVLACQAQQRVAKVDHAIDQVDNATQRVQSNADDIGPTLRDLRSAARALRQARGTVQP